MLIMWLENIHDKIKYTCVEFVILISKVLGYMGSIMQLKNNICIV